MNVSIVFGPYYRVWIAMRLKAIAQPSGLAVQELKSAKLQQQQNAVDDIAIFCVLLCQKC